MADPYRQQYGPPPTWPPQAAPPPPPRRKKRSTGLIITLSMLGTLAIVVGIVAIVGVLSDRNDPPGSDAPATPGSTLRPSEARPGVDVGAGTPGAGCATNRLGYWFVKDGVTYTCKGPKPYSWQP